MSTDDTPPPAATLPASEYIRSIIIQKRYELTRSIEKLMELKALGAYNSRFNATARGALVSLFLDLKPLLRRHLHPDAFENLREIVMTDKAEKLETIIEAFDLINDTLDELKLTRLDLHQEPRKPWVTGK